MVSCDKELSPGTVIAGTGVEVQGGGSGSWEVEVRGPTQPSTRFLA